MDACLSSTELFPTEMFLKVFEKLSVKELALITRVSRLWNSLTDDESLWKQISADRWPAYKKNEQESWKEHAASLYTANTHLMVAYKDKMYLSRLNHIFIRKSIDQQQHTKKIDLAHEGLISHFFLYNHKLLGPRYMTVATDNVLKVWKEGPENEPVPVELSQKLHEKRVTVIKTESDWLFSASTDGTIKTWKLDLQYKTMEEATHPSRSTLQEIAQLEGHGGPVTALHVQKSYKPNYIIYSGSADKTIRIWHFCTSGKFIEADVLKGHEDTVTALGVCSQYNTLISASRDGVLKIWNLNEAKKHICTETFKAHGDSINALLIPAFGNKFFTASSDRLIKCWEINDKTHKLECKITLVGHAAPITCLRYGRRDNGINLDKICSSDIEGVVCTWVRKDKDHPFACSQTFQTD